MVGVSEGLDLSNLSETTADEINANLIRVWSWRGPLYELYANSLMLDYAPDFAKLHRWGSDLFGRPSQANIITLSMQNIHSYMMFGWETGILNEFHTLRRNGMPPVRRLYFRMGGRPTRPRSSADWISPRAR